MRPCRMVITSYLQAYKSLYNLLMPHNSTVFFDSNNCDTTYSFCPCYPPLFYSQGSKTVNGRSQFVNPEFSKISPCFPVT